LAESEAACAAQKSETRIIAKELHDAQQLNAEIQTKLDSNESQQQALLSQIAELMDRIRTIESERDAAKAESEVMAVENSKYDELEESYEDALDKIETLEGKCFLPPNRSVIQPLRLCCNV
jgi:chromosome segregation ATPase